jgi:predicted GNAT family N-acyltransferase
MVVFREYGAFLKEYEQELSLRNSVLRFPLGLELSKSDTEGEKNQIHIGAFVGETIIGCVLVKKLNNADAQVRQMAVLPMHQGKGIGRQLVMKAEERCWEVGAERIFLHAREYAVGFYSRMAYTVSSEKFESHGIPHFQMEKWKGENWLQLKGRNVPSMTQLPA